jgi:hypothetical protein
MSLEWIRRYYSVPAKRGEPKILLNLHATWEVVYVNPAQESSTHSITDERTAV